MRTWIDERFDQIVEILERIRSPKTKVTGMSQALPMEPC